MGKFLVASLTALLLAAPFAHAQSTQKVEAQYQAWLQTTIWPELKRRGVSRAVFEAGTKDLKLNWKLPDLVPPGSQPKAAKKQSQAEFRSPANYFNQKSLANLANIGRQKAKKHARTLKALERKYGVPGRILLAIWARESGYGAAKIPYNAFDVLGTKGFMSTRKDLFTAEFLAAFQIVQRGDISASRMRSSWAGAMGQPQFLPTSFLKYAADGDGDGKRDIWNSEADTLASIANYLNQFGWQKGRDWGFEIKLPQSLSCGFEGPDQRDTIGRWADRGITRISGKAFPKHERGGAASLMLPAGRNGPAFLATPNFYVLKEYNESDLYALFVGHLGDKIDFGSKAFQAPWGGTDNLLRSDVAAMQRTLVNKGYDVGGADGLAGFKTRRAIGLWQAKSGKAPTCYPSRAVVNALR